MQMPIHDAFSATEAMAEADLVRALAETVATVRVCQGLHMALAVTEETIGLMSAILAQPAS